MSDSFEKLLGQVKVVPVITLHDAATAAQVAASLLEAGMPVLEVTLRTAAGLDAIREIACALPEAIVGAGSVRTPDQLVHARQAGAQFIVSPGCTDRLVTAAVNDGTPFIPGVATASEIMRAADYGFSLLKFFPAERSGGVSALRALSGPFPDIRFCPTGGINADRATDYLELTNVVCVGGSWMVPALSSAA